MKLLECQQSNQTYQYGQLAADELFSNVIIAWINVYQTFFKSYFLKHNNPNY